MIPSHVKTAFNVTGHGKHLAGGQDTSYLFDTIVIKPVDDAQYYEFTAQIFAQLQPVNYRISKPIKSNQGTYVVSGYAATRYERGVDCDSAIKEKLAASTLLHKDLKALNITQLPESHDPWTKANNVLWRGAHLPKNWSTEILSFCHSLLDHLERITDDYQLIHGDLGGNVFFDEELSPLVIDFSPTIAPKKYADAIIVCDSIAWAGVDLQSIELLQPLDAYKPYIKYAIAFRILTIAFAMNNNYDRLKEEWLAYKKIWSYINK